MYSLNSIIIELNLLKKNLKLTVEMVNFLLSVIWPMIGMCDMKVCIF